MITFEIHNAYTEVKASEEILDMIREWCVLEYEFYGMDWSTRPPRRKIQKGYVTYFTQDNKFPSGWTGKFYHIISNSLGIEVNIKDKRNSPKTSEANILSIKDDFELRGYQKEAFEKAVKKKRGILNHATGSGKTPLAGYILAKLGYNSLYIVPDITLLNQAIGDFINDVGIDPQYIGKIGDKVYDPKQITVCTVQSAWSLIKQNNLIFKEFLDSIDVLFFDEAHHIKMDNKGRPKNSYFFISMAVDAFYRFGLTATPGSKDSLDRNTLEGATGRVIDIVSSSFLIKNGYLTKPYIWMVRSPAKKISDWKTTYDHNIIENNYRNEVISRLSMYLASKGLSVLVSINLVKKHGVPLNDMTEGSKLLTGETPNRVEILDQFKNKEFNILFTTLVKEGVNIPTMDVLIYGAGGKSDKKSIQQTGRVLRVSDGKKVAIMIDFFDDDERGMLIKHSRKRKKVYESEEEFEFMGIVNIEEQGFDFLREIIKKIEE